MRAALLMPLVLVACSGPMPMRSDGGFLLMLPEEPMRTGSTGGGFGGGAALVDAGSLVSTKGVCTNTVEFPADLGRSCGAGSNQPLCVVQSQSTCGAGTRCVWDEAAPTTSRAYCTVGCTPGDATTCPGGWECLQQGCSNGPPAVCARRTTSTCTRIPEFSMGRIVVSSAIPAADVSIVGVLQGTMMRVFAMRGATVVRELDSVLDVAFNPRALGTFGREAWWSVAPKLVRVTETQVETFTTPGLTEYELAASNGTAISFAGLNASRLPVVATFRAGVFANAPTSSTVMNRFAVGQLGDGSLAGECVLSRSRTELCVTNDFITATNVALPAGAAMPERDWSISGASATDFAIVTADAVVRRYRNGQWTSDTLPATDTRAVLQEVGADRFLVRVGVADGGAPPSSLYLETPSCWRKLPANSTVYSNSLPNRHGYYSTGQQWCDVPLLR